MIQELYKKATAPNTNNESYYFKFSLKTNYDILKDKNNSTFIYESPDLTTSYGIKSEFNDFDKYKSSLVFTIDEKDPNQVRLMKDLDDIFFMP